MTPPLPDWRPMSEFNPDKPASVHDRLNDVAFTWKPDRHGRDWHKHGHRDSDDGVIEWHGLLLDGWMPLRRADAFPPFVGGPGRPDDDAPADERERFLRCPICGHMIDMRNLGEALEHEGAHDAPGKSLSD